MRAMFASDIGRIAGPPNPPLETNPSTLISNSSVSGSMIGSDGNVFDETIASAPPRKHAAASTTMSCVAGVSLVHTGTFATSFTTSVTTEQSPSSLPMFEPMSFRSMCGQEKLHSTPSAPASCTASVSVCQARSSLSLPEPAMIDAITTRVGNASFMRRMRGTHQSRPLSEISSQFHEPCNAAPGRFFIDTLLSSGVVRKNFVRAPTTLTTGCNPIVFTTTPPQRDTNVRRILLSPSAGRAPETRNGLSNLIPVNVTDRSGMAGYRLLVAGSLRHPVRSRLALPFCRHLLRLRPELDRSTAGDVAHAEARFVPSAERERLTRNRHADVHAYHARARALHYVSSNAAALGEHRRRVAVRRRVLNA